MASPQRAARVQTAAPPSSRSAKLRNQEETFSYRAASWRRSFLFASGSERRLQRTQQHIGRGHRFVHAECLEDLDVGRVVDAADRLLDPKVFIRHLQGNEVVLIIGRDSDDRIRPLDTHLSQETDLASV